MRLLLPILLASAAAILPAQDTADADSARVARTAWSNAIRALRDGNTVAARWEVDRAASAWPSQPYYRWQQVMLAARLDDSTALREGLTRYVGLGLGEALDDTVFSHYRSRLWFERLRLKSAENRVPLVRSVPHATLRTSDLWPEGVDIDPSTGIAYVTSIRRRTIVEIRGTVERALWPMDSGPGAVMAVRRDPAGDAVWVTIAGLPQMARFTPADTGIAALLKVRISDGVVLRRVDLPVGRHIPGDLAITPRGDVFIPDSHQPVLYHLPADREELQAIRHPLFRSLQGITVDPRGNIFVADYSHGLLRVDPSTGSVRRLKDAPNSTALGCDGIAWHDGALIAIQNGVRPARVMRFMLNARGDSITSATVIDRNSAIADEPTLGVVVGDDLYYVANSQWEKYTATGDLRPGATLTPPIILRLRLKT